MGADTADVDEADDEHVDETEELDDSSVTKRRGLLVARVVMSACRGVLRPARFGFASSAAWSEWYCCWSLRSDRSHSFIKWIVYWRNSCASCWLPSDQKLSRVQTVLTNFLGV